MKFCILHHELRSDIAVIIAISGIQLRSMR